MGGRSHDFRARLGRPTCGEQPRSSPPATRSPGSRRLTGRERRSAPKGRDSADLHAGTRSTACLLPPTASGARGAGARAEGEELLHPTGRLSGRWGRVKLMQLKTSNACSLLQSHYITSNTERHGSQTLRTPYSPPSPPTSTTAERTPSPTACCRSQSLHLLLLLPGARPGLLRTLTCCCGTDIYASKPRPERETAPPHTPSALETVSPLSQPPGKGRCQFPSSGRPCSSSPGAARFIAPLPLGHVCTASVLQTHPLHLPACADDSPLSAHSLN